MIEAPADQWRALAELADADPAYIERLRDRKPSKPSRRNRRRSSASNGTIRRNWKAAQVISQALLETLNRVNGESDNGNE